MLNVSLKRNLDVPHGKIQWQQGSVLTSLQGLSLETEDSFMIGWRGGGWRRADCSRQARLIRQFPVTRGDGKTSFLCWRSEPPQETYTTAQPLGQDRDFRQTTPQSSLSGIGLSFGE